MQVFLLHYPLPPWDHQLAEGRAVSTILTSMYCQYVVMGQILLEGRVDFGTRRRLELEFDMHIWIWAAGSGVLNLFYKSLLSKCQKFCKLIIKKKHHQELNVVHLEINKNDGNKYSKHQKEKQQHTNSRINTQAEIPFCIRPCYCQFSVYSWNSSMFLPIRTFPSFQRQFEAAFCSMSGCQGFTMQCFYSHFHIHFFPI